MANCKNSGNITDFTWNVGQPINPALYGLWDTKPTGYGYSCAVMSDKWSAALCGGRFGEIEERQAVICQLRNATTALPPILSPSSCNSTNVSLVVSST